MIESGTLKDLLKYNLLLSSDFVRESIPNICFAYVNKARIKLCKFLINTICFTNSSVCTKTALFLGSKKVLVHMLDGLKISS